MNKVQINLWDVIYVPVSTHTTPASDSILKRSKRQFTGAVQYTYSCCSWVILCRGNSNLFTAWCHQPLSPQTLRLNIVPLKINISLKTCLGELLGFIWVFVCSREISGNEHEHECMRAHLLNTLHQIISLQAICNYVLFVALWTRLLHFCKSHFHTACYLSATSLF